MTLGRAYIWTFLSLSLGAAISLYEHDWSWFSRSGSLIVIIGILLTSEQIIEELQLMRQRRRHSEQHQDSWSSHDWAEEAVNHKKLRTGEEEFSGRSHGLYMLILGTLVWGFGDIVGRFF